jgi:hypothetical protein
MEKKIMNEEVKTLTLSEDVLQRFEPDPLESIMLNSANKEAMIFARAIMFLAPMSRFNPREYQITIKYEEHTNLFKAFCTPSEEAILHLKPIPKDELLESYRHSENEEKEKGKIYPAPTEPYFGLVTPRAKFHNINEALSGCGGLINVNWNL